MDRASGRGASGPNQQRHHLCAGRKFGSGSSPRAAERGGGRAGRDLHDSPSGHRICLALSREEYPERLQQHAAGCPRAFGTGGTNPHPHGDRNVSFVGGESGFAQVEAEPHTWSGRPDDLPLIGLSHRGARPALRDGINLPSRRGSGESGADSDHPNRDAANSDADGNADDGVENDPANDSADVESGLGATRDPLRGRLRSGTGRSLVAWLLAAVLTEPRRAPGKAKQASSESKKASSPDFPPHLG